MKESPSHNTGGEQWVGQRTCPIGGKGRHVHYIPVQFLSLINRCSDSGRFITFLLFFTSGILLFKSLYPTGRIHKLLFTCHKGMALRTYLNPYVLFGGLCFDYISTRTGDCRLRIFRVNTFLHLLQLSSSRSIAPSLRLTSFLSNEGNRLY